MLGNILLWFIALFLIYLFVRYIILRQKKEDEFSAVTDLNKDIEEENKGELNE